MGQEPLNQFLEQWHRVTDGALQCPFALGLDIWSLNTSTRLLGACSFVLQIPWADGVSPCVKDMYLLQLFCRWAAISPAYGEKSLFYLSEKGSMQTSTFLGFLFVCCVARVCWKEDCLSHWEKEKSRKCLWASWRNQMGKWHFAVHFDRLF